MTRYPMLELPLHPVPMCVMSTPIFSGVYQTSSLPPGTINVSVTDPATGLRGLNSGVLADSNSTAVIDVTLTAAGSISGQVLDRDRNSVGAGVAVRITGSGLDQTILTDALGNYQFSFVPLGSYTLRATATDNNSGQTQVTITGTNQDVVAEIVYSSTGIVIGFVVDEDGHALSRGQCYLKHLGFVALKLYHDQWHRW